jgi:hypothetical protein
MADDNPTKLIDRLCHKCAEIATVNYTKGYESGGPPVVLIGPEIEWCNWKFVIRLVIAAMREPTEAMADAADNWPESHGPRATWRLMIDAALKE